MLRPYWLLIFFAALPFCAGAQTVKPAAGRQEIPSGVNLKRLVDRPDVIYTNVTSIKEGDKVWIGMIADVQICTAVPLESIKAIISDYSGYERTFRRTTASRIISRDDRGTEAFFEVTVGAMGITVVTGYTVFMEERINMPGRYLLIFTHVSDDGTIRNVYGFWYLEEVEIEGRSYTYFRYYASYDSLKIHILQKQAAALFIGAENAGMIKEAIGAAGKQH